jgi:hypothetical protein
LNGTRQLPIYADGCLFIGCKHKYHKEKYRTLLDASEEVGREVQACDHVLSPDSKFKYLETAVTNES